MALIIKDRDLKRALKWIKEQKVLKSPKSLYNLVEEASLKYNLDPKKTEFLLKITTS